MNLFDPARSRLDPDPHESAPLSAIAAPAAEALRELRRTSPLVHCITNTVVTNFTANALLAAGASPAMVDDPQESGVLAGVAGALLINLGTVTAAQAAGMDVAISAATAAGVPWVLDPVAIGALPLRTELARSWATRTPAVIRGNASEIGALAGGLGGRGVDSTASPEEVADVATELADRLHTVIAVSGPVDLITDGRRTVRVDSGTPLLTKVTGVGCALGALIGAGIAAAGDPLVGAVTATALVCVAGELAAKESAGPGSFAVALLDRLADVDPDTVVGRAGLR